MPTKQTVLMIEDDGFLASIYAQKLEGEGFEVELATNGEDGLKMAMKSPPSIILLDLVIPKKDGFAVLEELKAAPETARVPVIVFTNLGQREDIQRCMQLGADGYMIKAHALPQETIMKIRELLGQSSA